MRVSNVDLRLLKVFATVADRGGFTQAAASLNVGRPTISTQMADLEARLGMRLCERGRGGFSLTANGEQVLGHVQRLFAALEDFSTNIDDMHGNLTGDLNIALIDYMTTVPGFRITEVLRDFADQAPNVRLNLKVLPEEDLTRALLDGRIHFGITSGHERITGIDYTSFLSETLYVYGARNHDLFQIDDQKITKDMLLMAKWAGGPLWTRTEGHRVDDSHDVPANNLEAIIMLILSGRYIGQMPDFFAETWVGTGEIRALAPNIASERNELMIVTRTGDRRAGPLDLFLNLLKQHHSMGG